MEGQAIFAILVGAALAVFSLIMVGYPFFRGNAPDFGEPPTARPPEPSSAPEADDAGVAASLESVYDSIDTLELEYQLGNVPESQYREQLQAYRLEAAAAVKAQLESGAAPPELVLEREVLEARAGIRSAWQSCPQCDAPVPAYLALSRGPCPHCGAPVGDTGGPTPPQPGPEL